MNKVKLFSTVVMNLISILMFSYVFDEVKERKELVFEGRAQALYSITYSYAFKIKRFKSKCHRYPSEIEWRQIVLSKNEESILCDSFVTKEKVQVSLNNSEESSEKKMFDYDVSEDGKPFFTTPGEDMLLGTTDDNIYFVEEFFSPRGRIELKKRFKY